MKRRRHINISHLLTVFGIIGLLLVIVLNHRQFSLFIQVIHQVEWYTLILVVLVQVATFMVNAFYYRSILRVFTLNIGLNRLFEGALATNFVNYILPSLGLAGAGYLSQVLTPDVPRGISVLTQFMRYALSAISIFIMMPIGIGLIIVSGQSVHEIVRFLFIALVGVFLFGSIILLCVSREQWFKRIVVRFSRYLKRHFHSLDEKQLLQFIEDFYHGYHQIIRKWQTLIYPVGWSLIYFLFEMSTLYLVFVAYGLIVNPGIVIIGFCLANIVSIFGGVFVASGIYEIGMAGTFIALGVPVAVAFAVTIVYRIMNLLVGLPPGYIFYKKYLPEDA